MKRNIGIEFRILYAMAHVLHVSIERDNNLQSNDRVFYLQYFIAFACVATSHLRFSTRSLLMHSNNSYLYLLKCYRLAQSEYYVRLLKHHHSVNLKFKYPCYVVTFAILCKYAHDVAITRLKSVRLHNDTCMLRFETPMLDGLLSFSLLP